MESGYTERNVKYETQLTEPLYSFVRLIRKVGNRSVFGRVFPLLPKKRAARNKMESGYTERNVKYETQLTEPQGKLEKWNLFS